MRFRFTFLPGWLQALEAQTPLGPLRLISDVLQRCEALMLQGKVHFVIGHAHPGAPSPLDAEPYASARIGDDRLIPVSRPTGAAARAMCRRPRPARACASCGSPTESGLGRILRAVLGGRLEALPTRVVTAHHASVLRTMALDGRGLAWLPASLIEDELAHGRLVEAAGADWHIPLVVRLYRERKLPGRTAEAFWRAATGSAG